MKQVLLTGLLALACVASSYAQRSVTKTKTVTGPQGKTASSVVNRSAGDGVWTREAVKTGPNGKVATSSASGTYGGGSMSGTAHLTGPQGKTRIYSVSRTRK